MISVMGYGIQGQGQTSSGRGLKQTKLQNVAQPVLSGSHVVGKECYCPAVLDA